jgi:hypothetical protein
MVSPIRVQESEELIESFQIPVGLTLSLSLLSRVSSLS